MEKLTFKEFKEKVDGAPWDLYEVAYEGHHLDEEWVQTICRNYIKAHDDLIKMLRIKGIELG